MMSTNQQRHRCMKLHSLFANVLPFQWLCQFTTQKHILHWYKALNLHLNITRNSTIADKPLDAFVRDSVSNGDADSSLKQPSSNVSPRRICSFCVKGCKYMYKRTPKSRCARVPPLRTRRVRARRLTKRHSHWFVSRYEHMYGYSQEKVPCVPPFTITQGDGNWHRSIGYLWLPTNVP